MKSTKEIEFVTLVQEHQNLIHKICRLYTNSDAEHKDLFQEITIQLWKAYPKFRGDAKFSTWMYRVGINTWGAMKYPHENSIIVFTYIGFKTQELAATANMQVNLEEDNESLDEVVLIGYGSKSRKDLTGAVSMIKSETIEKLKPVDVAQALQGRSAGVSVTTASGSPGSGFRVLVRGVSTNGSNDPLVIVDGYVASMNSVNPDDIESLTVLKDAQAAIYGILGANGVILVTTKSGSKNSAPQVSYNVYSGVQETTKKLSLLNGSEYAALINESYAANGETIPYPNLNNLENDNDWQDNLFDQAMITNHNVSLSGGTDAITYYLGASHLDQEGIIASNKSNFKRDNVKLRLGIDVNS